jgi:hypothetical protein
VKKITLPLLLLLASSWAGCQTAGKGGIKITELAEVKRGTWGKDRGQFNYGETPAIRVAGYGGHEVMLELWEASRGLVNKGSAKIPKATARTTDEGIAFRNEFDVAQPMRVERTTWATTDWIVKLNNLQPGVYEVRLIADDGRRATASFRVMAK